MNRRDHLHCLLAAGVAAGLGPAHADETATTRIEPGVLERMDVRSAPGGLRLPYKRYRRGTAPRPTFFFLGGGPGVSNLGFVPPESWLARVDVVVLEYRGVGESSPALQSPHFGTALREPMTRLDVAGAAALQPGLAAGFRDLRAQGVDFQEYGLAALASDVEALRRQLGLARIGLVAHSFGTRIAQAVQTRYRAVVSASLQLSMNSPGGLLWYPDDTQSVWRRYLASEEARRNGLAETLAPMRAQGWSRPDGWSPADSRALMLSFFLSFNQGSRQRVFDAMVAAHQGCSTTWWLAGASYPLFIRFGFNWADFFVKGYVVDGSAEALAQVDAQGQHALFQSPSSVLFSGWAGFVDAGGAREVLPPVDYARTLGVIGEFDPSTPLERWPAGLPLAHRVELPGAGHADALHIAGARGAAWIGQLLALDQQESASDDS